MKITSFHAPNPKGPKTWENEPSTEKEGAIYIYICKCFSNELNLDHIQQYLDETVKISFDNNKPLMSKEGRHFFARSTISEDISK